MSSNSEIKLGVLAKDIITGFKGIVTSKIEFITKCTQYCLSPEIDSERDSKKLPEGHFFDESRLEVIGAGVSEQFSEHLASPRPPTGFEDLPTANLSPGEFEVEVEGEVY